MQGRRVKQSEAYLAYPILRRSDFLRHKGYRAARAGDDAPTNNRHAATETAPVIPPTDLLVMANNKKAKKSPKPANEPLLNIPEADQWRIIRESGILQKVNANSQPSSSQATTTAQEEEHLLSPFWEEFFAATALIIPFSFLLLMMEMYVNHFLLRAQSVV